MYDLIDYKGKFDIIQDKDLFDEVWDVKDGEISHEQAMLEIKNRLPNALYYGVPAYIGKNEELKKIRDDFYYLNKRKDLCVEDME